MRRVLVTGANSGIGFATCRSLLAADPDPTLNVLIACRTAAKARDAARRLTDERAVPVLTDLDLGDFHSVRDFADHATERHGEIEVLVNNAGVFLSEGDDAIVRINAVSPVWLMSNIRPHTRVVNVITAPHVQRRIGTPSAENLYRPHKGIFGKINRYVYSKQLLSCASAHLASERPEARFVLIGPGAVDTGIHGKFGSDVNILIRAMLWFQSKSYHGTVDWAGKCVADAALGAFDPVPGRVSVVDLGKIVLNDAEFLTSVEGNRDVYESLSKIFENEGTEKSH